MKSNADIAKRLCDLLDLDRTDLQSVRECIEHNDWLGALVAFRDRFVDVAASVEFGDPPGLWLWTPTRAEDLLDRGVVATSQYGEFDRVTEYALGYPGEVEWNRVPDDGYDVVLRDVATMHWTSRLIDAYRKHRNVEYLRSYLGYWDDFARNWPTAHGELLREKRLIRWGDHPPNDHRSTSIAWASTSKLYFAWRLDNLFSWLPVAIAVSPDAARESIDPQELARVIVHVAEFEIPGALRGLEAIGTPNQFVHCALGLLKTALVLRGLKESPTWMQTAIDRMVWYAESGGYLADGSDMEQSFNYNPGLIHALDAILHIARSNPPLNEREAPWMFRFQQMRDYRERFLDSLVMPDGRRPATGCDNTFRYSREDAVAEHLERLHSAGLEATLGDAIRDQLLGDGTLPAPEFTSICFPYGGWVAMRDGWDLQSIYAFLKTSRPAPGHMREGGNGVAVAAFGRYLIVNSGDDAYSDRGVFSQYFNSTVSQSSISVDGYSQLLNTVDQKIDYRKPIHARWHTSPRFDIAEGRFASRYGGWSFRTGEVSDPVVDDTVHHRQIIFFRRLGAFVCIDRVSSESTHDFAASWCLGPDFAEDEVDVDPAGLICTTRSGSGANVELRFFSRARLALNGHWGEKDGDKALGWRALDWDEKLERYTPAVDLLTEWRGEGTQIVVALIVPTEGRESRVLRCVRDESPGAVGFDAEFPDGALLSVRASVGGELEALGVEASAETLAVESAGPGGVCGVSLDSDFGDGSEFLVGENGETHPIAGIAVPGGFRWTDTMGGLVPEYR